MTPAGASEMRSPLLATQ